MMMENCFYTTQHNDDDLPGIVVIFSFLPLNVLCIYVLLFLFLFALVDSIQFLFFWFDSGFGQDPLVGFVALPMDTTEEKPTCYFRLTI